jgi:protein involved in polysaccharide export with SLBB domain
MVGPAGGQGRRHAARLGCRGRAADSSAGYGAWKFPVPMAQEGTTEIHYYSVSLDGAIETPKVGYVRIDLTPPSVKAKASAKYRRKAVIRVTASDPYSGVKTIEWKVDRGKWHSLSRSVVNVTVKKAGRHKVSFRATDRAGHRSATRVTRSFTVKRR